MFRNQYDTDVYTWSPQGRLHQVEYAMEAVKQGSATVGIRSDSFAVLAALKRAANDLCSHQQKIFEIDSHVAVSIAGLLSDGRILARFLQTECASWRWDHKEPVPLSVLSERLMLKLQQNTQYCGRRPFGVGLLIAGYDSAHGAQIIRSDPSAETLECHAMSIGARSQSARTYLEKHLDSFAAASRDELITHALRSLRDTLPAEENLNSKNTTISVVGKGEKLHILEGAALQPYLDKMEDEPRARPSADAAAPPAASPGGDGEAPMDQDPGVAGPDALQ